ncbi:hypothetical protein pb186bvf_004444 [Paramecium bursaria]
MLEYSKTQFQYDEETKISHENYKTRSIFKWRDKIYRIIEPHIQWDEYSKKKIYLICVSLQFKLTDIRNAVLKNKYVFQNDPELFDDKKLFQKLVLKRNCLIYGDLIINQDYKIREIPSIQIINYSKCSKYLTCISQEKQFHIIEVSTLRDIFTIRIKDHSSEIIFDFEKSILTETIKNIQYQTFVYIIMESTVDSNQQHEILRIFFLSMYNNFCLTYIRSIKLDFIEKQIVRFFQLFSQQYQMKEISYIKNHKVSILNFVRL